MSGFVNVGAKKVKIVATRLLDRVVNFSSRVRVVIRKTSSRVPSGTLQGLLLAACRLQLVERDKFRDLMEIRLDKQEKNIEIENKKREGGKLTPNYSKRHELDNSIAEKTWKDMAIALLGNVERPSVKSEIVEET